MKQMKPLYAHTYLKQTKGKLFPDINVVMVVIMSNHPCLASSQVTSACRAGPWLRHAQLKVSVARIAAAKIKHQVVTAFSIAHTMGRVSVAFESDHCSPRSFTRYLLSTKINVWDAHPRSTRPLHAPRTLDGRSDKSFNTLLSLRHVPLGFFSLDVIFYHFLSSSLQIPPICRVLKIPQRSYQFN